jgi:hypothetical protein
MKDIPETYLMKDTPECTWWRIFQNVPDEGYPRTYLMKDIPERTWWRISQNVPDEGYFRTYLMKDIPERTWWRIFQNVLNSKQCDDLLQYIITDSHNKSIKKNILSMWCGLRQVQYHFFYNMEMFWEMVWSIMFNV